MQALYRVEAGKGWPQADSLIAIMELYEVYDIREITQKRNLKKAGREIEPSAPYSLCNSDGDKAIIEVEKANIKDPDWEIRVISRLKAFYDYFVGIKHCDAS